MCAVNRHAPADARRKNKASPSVLTAKRRTYRSGTAGLTCEINPQRNPPLPASKCSMSKFSTMVEAEIAFARREYAPINSAHEGYSVILEELDEFWEQVRLERGDRSKEKMVSELVQVAAMAQRTAEDLSLT